jgi:hypothetical protein
VVYAWCGYEVPGKILLRNLRGAILLDHSKDMSVHISTFTNYDFSALDQLCGSGGADKTCIFCLVTKMISF